MATLFAFGEFWFWVLTIAVFLGVMALVHFEKYTFAFVAVLATIALLYFTGNSGVLPWIRDNPGLVIGGVGGYIVAGTVWSFFKWFLFVVDRKEKLLDYKDQWEKKNPNGDFKLHFNDADSREYSREHERYFMIKEVYGMPRARDNKSRILAWMGWWPWSLLNALLVDFFRRVFHHIFNIFRSWYEGIANKVYGDLRKLDSKAT